MASAAREGFGALSAAKLLALVVPAALLAGAYGSQYIGGLAPCDMCYWQRYPHWTAIGFAAASFLLAGLPDRGRSLVWLAAIAILVSGGIGVYHAGVEAGVFQGFTGCSNMPASFEDLMTRQLVSCNDVQFRFLGVSMAGWNAIISISSALIILWLSLKRPRNLAAA